MLADVLSRYWQMTLIRGLIWILFGVVVLTRPAISLVTLTLLFGAFVLADGLANIVSAIGGRRQNENWWLLLFAGLAGIGIGVLTFLNPALTLLALVMYIAVWAIMTGVLEVMVAIRLRREIEGEGWLILSGLVSVAFGALLAAWPGRGAVAMLWVLASYAIAFGVIQIVLAFRERGFANRVSPALRG